MGAHSAITYNNAILPHLQRDGLCPTDTIKMPQYHETAQTKQNVTLLEDCPIVHNTEFQEVITATNEQHFASTCVSLIVTFPGQVSF